VRARESEAEYDAGASLIRNPANNGPDYNADDETASFKNSDSRLMLDDDCFDDPHKINFENQVFRLGTRSSATCTAGPANRRDSIVIGCQDTTWRGSTFRLRQARTV
ncbi:uncharacterized protein METZ01_LOCUS458066, partial [marine metagenome]